MLGKLLIGLAALVVVAGVAVGVTLYVTRAPEPGEFYDPPRIAADTAPGTLLRSERFTPGGLPEGTEAWRILYVTEGPDGGPVPVSGMVFTGAAAREADGPRPVIAWGHGAIGVARGCAPSLLETPAVVVPPLEAALARGWVVVATDYPGLGAPGFHPFLIGDETGRSVLDAVRAARELDAGVEVGDRYALWGESQGGHAVLSAAQLATEGYAPDLDLVGVAAGAPATDLAPLMTEALTRPAGKVLASQAVVQWTKAYPELSFDGAITPVARPLVRAISRRCIFPDFFVVAAQTVLLPKKLLRIDITADPRWARRLAQNTPSRPIGVPVLIAQGQDDVVVDPAVQARYVAKRCAAGQDIAFREFPGTGHIDVMGPATPVFADWTSRLFAGAAVPAGCETPAGALIASLMYGEVADD